MSKGNLFFKFESNTFHCKYCKLYKYHCNINDIYIIFVLSMQSTFKKIACLIRESREVTDRLSDLGGHNL